MKQLFFLLIFLWNGCYIQAKETNDDLSAKVIHCFQRLQKVPSEKLYLQLDKPYYSAGENIWYSIYLVDGKNLQQSNLSQYVYIELIDKNNSVLIRQKVAKDTLGFYGNMLLPAKLPKGDYHLRAYTWWMQNDGLEYFFQRSIHIGNEIDKSIQSKISILMEDKNTANANISFSSNNNISITKRPVTYLVYKGEKLIKQREAEINSQGQFHFGFKTDSTSNEQYRIRILLNDNELNYETNFYLPAASTDFDCQFFPEGGNLLSNGVRNVAFKAIGTNGLSTNVTGVVYNEKGDSILSFESTHKGMGQFSIPLNDDGITRYYAKVQLKGATKSKTIPLPEVKNAGYGIRLFVYRNRIIYSIISANKEVTKKQTLYLLIHQGQNLLSCIHVNDTTQWNGIIKTSTLPSGVIHFALLDENENILSDRLAFVWNNEKHLSMKTDKDFYAKREQVSLDLMDMNDTDSISSGKYSVSVTADETVKTDSLAGNICSSLLLTSDLKGNIEEPGFYFNDINHFAKLDLVMLTNGWTRFHLPDILQNDLPTSDYFIEKGQTISGKIKGFWGGKAKKAEINVIEAKTGKISQVYSDENGKFVTNRLAFPDSARYIVTTRSKNGKKTVELQLDSVMYPKTTFLHSFEKFTADPTIERYMENSSRKYFNDGGMRVYHLKEVTVTGYNKDVQNRSSLLADYSANGDELAKRFPGRSLLDVIKTIPGFIFEGNLLRKSGSLNGITLIVDNFVYQGSYNPFIKEFENNNVIGLLACIDVEAVRYVNFFGENRGEKLAGKSGVKVAREMGKNTMEGIAQDFVVVILKEPFLFSERKPNPSMAIFTPLPIHKPDEFYSPKYKAKVQTTSFLPDLRSTIYWNPSFTVENDESTTLSFYTGDFKGSYTITVEGITDSGEPIHQEKKIFVK